LQARLDRVQREEGQVHRDTCHCPREQAGQERLSCRWDHLPVRTALAGARARGHRGGGGSSALDAAELGESLSGGHTRD
jgi:hypothetical protein